MPGLQHDHLVGVVQKFSFWSFDVQSLTGQSAMFWFDLLLLVLEPQLQQEEGQMVSQTVLAGSLGIPEMLDLFQIERG